jgi:hypothetical protein
LTLTVVGGSAPYVWSLSGLDDFAFDSNPSTSSTLEVSGQLTVAGRHEVGISVQAGEGEACQSSSTSFPLDVVAAPVIGIAGLEEACVGEAVVLTLSATGGDRAGDVWTVKDEALPSGLRLEGNTIVGTPSLEGAFTFEVTLESGRCQPVRRGVSLSVRAAGECPSITTDALAAPCEGIEYFAPLVASSGEPPYEWDLVEGPSWLSIDAATQTLHGLPDGTASGRVTLRVRDARQHGMSRSYAFEPRQSCYFAYVSQAAESPGLHYADVFLARDVLVSRDIPVGSQVADFEFSPDGGFIAFRAGVGNEHALYLYATASSTPAEASSVQRLPLECPLTGADAGLAACGVLDYAWSADSRHLAVVLGEPGAPENYLSGMDVAAPTSQWPALATTYRGELVWVESMAVAYSGERTPAVFVGEESPFFSFYTAEGRLSAPESLAFYASDVRLRATPTGLFFVDGSAEVYHLSLGPNGAVGVRPHARGWASPSGRYVAEANPEGQLRLYGVDDPDTVLAESEPGSCEVVFTWAEQREMIACTRSLSSAQGNPESVPPVIEGLPFSHGSGLRIFEFRPDAELAQRLISWSIPLEHYSTGDTAGRRRSFSLGGDKLVFITDFAGSERIQAISVARDATSGSSRIDRGMRQPIELAFSPRGDSYVTYEAAALIQFATPELGSFAATVTDALEGRFYGGGAQRLRGGVLCQSRSLVRKPGAGQPL